ncbi:hypothetical protein GcM1_232051 [Golovinomyces cichoracearum]|uniref:2EXR domain-containing protein n=1 Tax=Golovinomyces cichoracearum TaxID=62708 RepID=A0A420IM89_9PEZI|nr:hypothetical protein GcM1_232051 [Golovinomyces cichoracearum]
MVKENLIDLVSSSSNIPNQGQVSSEPGLSASKDINSERSNEAEIMTIETAEHANITETSNTRRKLKCLRKASHPPPVDAPASPAPTTPISRHHSEKSSISRIKTVLSRSIKRQTSRFPRFSELPTEIRLLIWGYAFVPRVHELHPCAKLYNERITFRSNSSRTPSLFHVCRESRALAFKNYSLMSYEPRPSGSSGKGILRFYFSPELDTLFLNSLMGLFIMFMLLEDEDEYAGVGVMVMKGWQKIAFDAERVQLISLLAGIAGHAPHPRLKAVFPSLKDFTIAFDYSAKGKIRFRTSVWPGENGTSLEEVILPSHPDAGEEPINGREKDWAEQLNTILRPMRHYLDLNFKDEDESCVPTVKLANVKRKAFLRGDIRYAFRKTCTLFGLRPRGPFRRL